MFSETGNWVSDIFDGAICEYDLIDGKNRDTSKKFMDAT